MTTRKNSIEKAKIVENISIANGVFRLKLFAPAAAALALPGQFVNLYLEGGGMLLPRPLSIAGAEGGCLVFVYAAVGKGTEALARREAGAPLNILGPNGNGYDLEAAGDRVILSGGGLGIPTLLFAAKRLRERGGVKIVAALGYKNGSERFCLKEMRELCEPDGVVYSICEQSGGGEAGANEAGGGNVLDLLNGLRRDETKNATLLACGPRVMLRAVTEWAAGACMPSQISMEERMGCGYGACLSCACSIREGRGKAEAAGADGRRKICVDGPVFRGGEIAWEEL